MALCALIFRDKSSFIRIPQKTKIFIEVANSFENWIQGSISSLALLPLHKVSNFSLQDYQVTEKCFESDDFNFVYFYLKNLESGKLSMWNPFIFNPEAKQDPRTNLILHKFRKREWTWFKPIFNVNYESPFYSREEATEFFKKYFLENLFLRNADAVSFAKFKLFLSILRDQITNMMMLTAMYPHRPIMLLQWREVLFQSLVDCAVRFLNSNMSILSK